MAMRFHIDIVCTESLIYSGQADHLIVPTQMGELGILARHAPLLAFLKPGLVRVMLDNKQKYVVFVSTGFIEVQSHTITILTDVIIRSDEFDRALAKAARYLEHEEDGMRKRSIDSQLSLEIALYRTLGEITKTKNIPTQKLDDPTEIEQ